MAKKPKQSSLGSVLIKYQGQYYFIPADLIGEPLELSGAEIRQIEKNVAELKTYGVEDEHNVDFAVQISSNEIAIKIRRRN